MTQRTASTRLDLPQPFGPTTPVRPGSITKSVGSTKDLKPIRRRRVSFISRSNPDVRRETTVSHRRGECVDSPSRQTPRLHLSPPVSREEAEKTCENQSNT